MTNHPTITIAPLSIPGAMSQAAWRCIQQADALFLQTDQSPCARPVLDAGLAYRSMDDLYASAQDFDQLNQAIARRLCEAGDGAVYAVCGGGMGDGALQALLAAAQAEGLSVRQLPGAGFGASALCALPQALPVSGMTLCTAYDLPASLDPYHTLCIEDVDTPLTAGDVKLALGEYYPDEYLLWFCVLGGAGGRRRPLRGAGGPAAANRLPCPHCPGAGRLYPAGCEHRHRKQADFPASPCFWFRACKLQQ